MRPMGRPEPLRVATSLGLPSSPRVRMFARRAWKVPKFETEEISRYVFWLGIQTSMSYVSWAEKPVSPAASLTTR